MFILRHTTPKKASLHLKRTTWSHRRKIALGEVFSVTDQGLPSRIGSGLLIASPEWLLDADCPVQLSCLVARRRIEGRDEDAADAGRFS